MDDFSEIRDLVRRGDVPGMERLIASGWDVNTCQYWTGATALNLAAHAGDAGMVELLLRHGADPNTQDNDGYYAYGVVVRQEIRRLLLAYGFSRAIWQPTIYAPDTVVHLRVLAPREPLTRTWAGTVSNGDLFVEHLLMAVPRPGGRVEVAVALDGRNAYTATLSAPGTTLHRLTEHDGAASATVNLTCTEFVGELYVRLFSSAAVDRLEGARSFWLPDLSMYEGPP